MNKDFELMMLVIPHGRQCCNGGNTLATTLKQF